MTFKLIAFAALAALARASDYGAPLPYAVAETVGIAKTVVAETSSPAHYDFGYGVSDPLTGDSKTQHESRRGDFVQGRYSLVDSDGTRRVVNYAADPLHGFNAVVSKEPLAVKAVAPVIAKVAAPAITYGAPAPVVKYAAPVVAERIVTKIVDVPAVTKVVSPGAAKVSQSTTTFAAPAISYAAPIVHQPVVTRIAAPAHSYAAPAFSGYSFPTAYGYGAW